MTDDHTLAVPQADTQADTHLDTQARRNDARARLRHRHSQNLTRLMEERSDLHGVHALADFVAESLRWTA